MMKILIFFFCVFLKVNLSSAPFLVIVIYDFLCPHLPLAGVGYIAFRRDVTSVRMCVRHIRNQVQVYLQV